MMASSLESRREYLCIYVYLKSDALICLTNMIPILWKQNRTPVNGRRALTQIRTDFLKNLKKKWKHPGANKFKTFFETARSNLRKKIKISRYMRDFTLLILDFFFSQNIYIEVRTIILEIYGSNPDNRPGRCPEKRCLFRIRPAITRGPNRLVFPQFAEWSMI